MNAMSTNSTSSTSSASSTGSPLIGCVRDMLSHMDAKALSDIEKCSEDFVAHLDQATLGSLAAILDRDAGEAGVAEASVAEDIPVPASPVQDRKLSGKVVSNVDDGTGCPICMHQLLQPVNPPCQHPLCAACADELCGSSHRPACPICRAAVSRKAYAPSPVLAKMITKIHDPEAGPSNGADVKAGSTMDAFKTWRQNHRDRAAGRYVSRIWNEIKNCVSAGNNALLLIEGEPPRTEARSLWDGMWPVADEIKTRLELQKLRIKLFKTCGKNYMLIEWE